MTDTAAEDTMGARAFTLVAPFLLALALPMASQAQTTHIVTVSDNVFTPSSLTIQAGDTVEWRNAAGGNQHNVTSEDGLFQSTTASSFTFSYTFDDPGTFDYTCTIHFGMDGTITVEGAGGGGEADLAVIGVDAAAGTYAPGDGISIDVTIQNVGDADSGAFTVDYYASADATVTGADTLLGSDNRAALAAGATDSYTANPSFPGGIANGTWFIGAIVDVNDADNGNNSGVDNATIAISTPQQDEPDLALTEISAPSGSFEQGSMFMVDAEVENVGSAASGAFTVDYYASDNASITGSDRLLGSENWASLAAGENANSMFQLTIPSDLAPGDYFIGGIIDISDANNDNNDNADDEPLTVTESTGTDFPINAGLNDSWFNPATAGQGFFITVFPDIEMMFLAWFTYDVERPPEDVTAMLGGPGQRWLTAFGPYSGDTAMLEVEITTGGTFDSPEPAPTQTVDGTMTVTFTGCNAGQVVYDVPSAGVSGTVPIQRLANDNIPYCESLASP